MFTGSCVHRFMCSCVKCHVSPILFLDKIAEPVVGGGSDINGAYLVYFYSFDILISITHVVTVMTVMTKKKK